MLIAGDRPQSIAICTECAPGATGRSSVCAGRIFATTCESTTIE